MKTGIKRFINYIKEAFFHPFHLIGAGGITVVTALSLIILPLIFPDINPAPLILVGGGLEFFLLGAISQNDRFIRATNAKYGDEIAAFYRTEAITEYYNKLSAPRQRRFEHFKTKLDEIRANYQSLHGNYPNLVNKFLAKISNLQHSYIRLLFMQDKFPSYLERESPDEIRKQMADLKLSMEADSGKLKKIKQKRVGLMEKRIVGYQKAKENGKIVGAQLQTIEEMIEFIKDQPVTLKSTDEDDMLIDNILFETEQMQDTISDMENILTSDYVVGDYGDMDGTGMEAGHIKE